MTNKIRHALAAVLALVALGGPLALVATADSASAQPMGSADPVRVYDLAASSTPAPAAEETVIVLPETKIYGTRPVKVAAKPAAKPCRETNEGSRPLLSDYQGTVRSFTFCN